MIFHYLATSSLTIESLVWLIQDWQLLIGKSLQEKSSFMKMKIRVQLKILKVTFSKLFPHWLCCQAQSSINPAQLRMRCSLLLESPPNHPSTPESIRETEFGRCLKSKVVCCHGDLKNISNNTLQRNWTKIIVFTFFCFFMFYRILIFIYFKVFAITIINFGSTVSQNFLNFDSLYFTRKFSTLFY